MVIKGFKRFFFIWYSKKGVESILNPDVLISFSGNYKEMESNTIFLHFLAQFDKILFKASFCHAQFHSLNGFVYRWKHYIRCNDDEEVSKLVLWALMCFLSELHTVFKALIVLPKFIATSDCRNLVWVQQFKKGFTFCGCFNS